MEPISILNAAELRNSESSFHFSDLFQLPEILEAIAPGEAWYAKWEVRESLPVYFPFLGQKWLWKWRIYQPLLCQRFQPMAALAEISDEAWKSWMTWMERKCWFAHWNFTPPQAIQTAQTGIQYRLSLDNQDFKSKLVESHFHKENYKMAGFVLVHLEAGDFFRELKLLVSKGNFKSWKPGEKEIKALQRISRITLDGLQHFYWAIFENGKCLSLFQLAHWNQCMYTLCSHHVSSDQQFQGWLFLMQKLWSQWESVCNYFVFPAQVGSANSPVFLHLGAVEEKYGIYTL